MEEIKLMSDLNFCLKMISQNRLYEADDDYEEAMQGGAKKKDEVM